MFVLLTEGLICTWRESTYFDSLEQHFKKVPPNVKFISALVFSLVNFISFDPTKKNYVLYLYNKSVLLKKIKPTDLFSTNILVFQEMKFNGSWKSGKKQIQLTSMKWRCDVK